MSGKAPSILRFVGRLGATAAAALEAAATTTELKQQLEELRTKLEALLAQAETHRRQTTTCVRCGVKVDITMDRAAGPKLMERTAKDEPTRYVVACDGCVPFVKRAGWIKARPQAGQPPADTPPAEPTVELPEGAKA